MKELVEWGAEQEAQDSFTAASEELEKHKLIH
jgi:hypothetical protein